jgi:hypothetical protein
MEMKPVKSSNIDAIGHCHSTNSLHVKFKNGGTYVYSGVDAKAHAALAAAESIGAHLSKHIKPHHKAKRV